MKNKHLETIKNTLIHTQLNFTQARVRDAFVKSIEEKQKEVSESSKKILESLGTLDQKTGLYEFEKDENRVKALAELDILGSEDSTLEISDEIKEFGKSSNYKVGYKEVEIIDEVLK